MKRVLVIGGSGDVGQGVVRAASGLGWRVAAAARDADRLSALTASTQGELVAVTGSVASVEEARALADAALAALGGLDAVVVSVNGPTTARPMLAWEADGLIEVMRANVLSHFAAAKAVLPRLAPGGLLLGIGGGMADFVPPGRGHISMAAAALRNMYRALARDSRDLPVQVRELLIVSMVNGASKRDVAEPSWITDGEVGRHVCAVLAEPARFPGPILSLTSRDQVGRPDVA